jgi:hypothetical protein
MKNVQVPISCNVSIVSYRRCEEPVVTNMDISTGHMVLVIAFFLESNTTCNDYMNYLPSDSLTWRITFETRIAWIKSGKLFALMRPSHLQAL